jgi:hypothetical protein
MGSEGYCIFVDTLADGPVAAYLTNGGVPLVFATRAEADRQIAEDMNDRLTEFIEGQRDLDDAIITEDYVVRVRVHPDGSITPLSD